MTQSESQRRAKDKWNKTHPEKLKEYIARYRKKLKAERPEKIAEWDTGLPNVDTNQIHVRYLQSTMMI